MVGSGCTLSVNHRSFPKTEGLFPFLSHGSLGSGTGTNSWPALISTLEMAPLDMPSAFVLALKSRRDCTNRHQGLCLAELTRRNLRLYSCAFVCACAKAQRFCIGLAHGGAEEQTFQICRVQAATRHFGNRAVQGFLDPKKSMRSLLVHMRVRARERERLVSCERGRQIDARARRGRTGGVDVLGQGFRCT